MLSESRWYEVGVQLELEFLIVLRSAVMRKSQAGELKYLSLDRNELPPAYLGCTKSVEQEFVALVVAIA